MDAWTINLREAVYGPTSLWVSLDGTGSGSRRRPNAQSGTTPITDLDIGYKVTDYLKLDIGANNLFRRPSGQGAEHFPTAAAAFVRPTATMSMASRPVLRPSASMAATITPAINLAL